MAPCVKVMWEWHKYLLSVLGRTSLRQYNPHYVCVLSGLHWFDSQTTQESTHSSNSTVPLLNNLLLWGGGWSKLLGVQMYFYAIIYLSCFLFHISSSFKIYFIFSYVHVCVCVCECRCPQRPVEGARSPCAGVPGGCEF